MGVYEENPEVDGVFTEEKENMAVEEGNGVAVLVGVYVEEPEVDGVFTEEKENRGVEEGDDVALLKKDDE